MAFKLRRTLWSLHRWLGLSCAVVIVVLALSGMAMLMQHPMNLVDAEEVPRTQVLSVAGIDAGIQALRELDPAYAPILLTPPPTAAHGWQAYLSPTQGTGPRRIASLDAASGRVLGVKDYTETRMGSLLLLHTELFAGRSGLVLVAILGAAALLLSVMGVVVLRRRWKTFRSNPVSGPDRWRSLHRWTGIAGFGFLLMWTLSGLVLQLSMLGPNAHAIATDHAARPVELRASMRAVLEHRAVQEAGELFAISLPTQNSPYVFVTTMHRRSPPWAKFQLLQFGPANGHLISRRTDADLPLLQRAMSIARVLHMGLFETKGVQIAYLAFGTLVILGAIAGPVSWVRSRFRGR